MLQNKLSVVAFSYTALMDVGCQLLKYVLLTNSIYWIKYKEMGILSHERGSRGCIIAECVQLK